MITRAAVKLHLYTDGRDILLPVHRHCDAYHIMKEIGFKPHEYRKDMEGFLTDDGTFVDRAEAIDIAKECGQLSHLSDEDIESVEASGCLFSEDLW